MPSITKVPDGSYHVRYGEGHAKHGEKYSGAFTFTRIDKQTAHCSCMVNFPSKEELIDIFRQLFEMGITAVGTADGRECFYFDL